MLRQSGRSDSEHRDGSVSDCGSTEHRGQEVLLPPVKLCLGDTCGKTICLGLRPTLQIAPVIPKDSSCEDNEDLFGGAKVAVPAARRIERATERFYEIGQGLIFHAELNKSPRQGLTGAYVANVAPADLTDLKGHTFKRHALQQALCDQDARNAHVGIVVPRRDQGGPFEEVTVLVGYRVRLTDSLEALPSLLQPSATARWPGM